MKNLLKFLSLIIFSILVSNCKSAKNSKFESKIIYKSDELVITQVSENAFVHTSFLQTNDFGNVPCNGLVVRDNNEAIIFDTPTNDQSSELLIQWVEDSLHSKINAIIPTHFHEDCLGGLQAFHNHKIPSYANQKTIELAKKENMVVPQNRFDGFITLSVGNKKATAKFFGEGHTKDITVGYFPSEKVMFGGCLIKEVGANKGYLGDANVEAWSNTVEKVKNEYSDVKVVVPGHGSSGDIELLNYTINLFKVKQ